MMAIVSPGVAPPAAAEGAAAPPAYLARKTTDSRAKNARIRARYNPPVIPSPRQSPYCDPPTSIKYSMIATISGSIHPTGFPCALHQPSRHYVRYFYHHNYLNARIRARYNLPVIPSTPPVAVLRSAQITKCSMFSTISGSVHPTGFPCVLRQRSRHYVRVFNNNLSSQYCNVFFALQTATSVTQRGLSDPPLLPVTSAHRHVNWTATPSFPSAASHRPRRRQCPHTTLAHVHFFNNK